MTYFSRVPGIILQMLIFALFISSFSGQKLQVFIASILFIVTFLQFRLRIFPGMIEYKITIFKITLFRKVLTGDNIKKIKFGRIGWTSKNAVVKVRGGFNFGVAYFYSEQLILELEEFALANNIEVQKTKDYKLLEKYYTHN